MVSEKRNKVMKLNKKNEVKKMGTREDWSFNPEQILVEALKWKKRKQESENQLKLN